jgi:XapX domain-containing protein
MGSPRNQRMKVVMGQLFGLVIAVCCRFVGILSPAPPTLTGSLLVLAITSGCAAMGCWLGSDQVEHQDIDGDPDDLVRGGASKRPPESR